MLRARVGLARTAGRLSRRLGRGGGTSLPGKVLLRLQPGALGYLATGLDDGVGVISATNGKTTTARLVVAALRADGRRPATNAAGANLGSGVATALLDADRARPRPRTALFEVDEAALPEVVRELAPGVVVLMNLFRDQLDRYGELDRLVEDWRTMVAGLPDETTLVVNADDPSVASLAEDREGTVAFGLEDVSHALPSLPHAADAIRCPRCAERLAYSAVLVGHMGHWSCPRCGHARTAPDIAATHVALDGMRGQRLVIEGRGARITAELPLAGLHNAYNATAAAAVALGLGVAPEVIGPALSARAAAFGRGEVIRIEGREVVLMLAKNPAGANENVHTLLLDDEPLDLLILLNDRAADGRDVSWIWDVDYELLVPRVRSLTLSGDRAWDLALRFRYSGLPTERMLVVPRAARALDAALAQAPGDSRLHVLPTYTALLDLRARLRRRGVVDAFWRDA